MNNSVQVNIPAESGEMGVLANHVPSIEQLKPGLVEIIEESGGTKHFFRMCPQSPTHQRLSSTTIDRLNFGSLANIDVPMLRVSVWRFRCCPA